MLDATCKGLFVHPFKKGAVIISFSIYYGTLRNDITNCSGIVILYYNPKPLTHMVNSRGGISRTLGLCLAGCFCQLDFVEVASLGAPGIFRV